MEEEKRITDGLGPEGFEVLCENKTKGGAYSKYTILFNKEHLAEIKFMTRPVSYGLPDGITSEALLVILRERLEGFQRGPFACGENASCLENIKMAQERLYSRTTRRKDAGIEGKYTETYKGNNK